MKKTIVLVAACVLAAAALVSFAGCGSSGASSKSKGNNSSGSVTESELGVPIYPGAKKQDESAYRPRMSAPQSTPEGSNWSAPGSMPNWNNQSSAPRFGGGSMTALWTPDSTDKVTAWYREKLKGKTGFSERARAARAGFGQQGAETIFSFQSGNTTKVVMVGQSVQNNSGTTIRVSDASQGMPSGPPTNQGNGQTGTTGT